MKVAQNELRKRLLGFSLYINIENFESFLWNLKLSAKHLFWRCVQWTEMPFFGGIKAQWQFVIFR